MPDIVELRAEMEESLTWRKTEYISLKNLLKDENRVPVVKTLIVMLYAHFEGFFKDCLDCYIKYLNSIDKELKYFQDSIVAASLTREFASFEDINRRCRELTTSPPVEEPLHRYHRRKELALVFRSNYLEKKIRISDKIINTKSNLNYGVLQENLYVLGLDHNCFSDKQNSINTLVNFRNSVAHGSQRDPIGYDKLEVIESEILLVMEEIILYLYKYCEESKFLKTG